MLSLDAAIKLDGGKTATKWTKTQFGQAHFENRCGSIPPMEGGGGCLCVILAKWGVGIYPDTGVNLRGYSSYKEK